MSVSCTMHGEDEKHLIGKPKGNICLCRFKRRWQYNINPLNAKLNPICHFLALFGAHHIFHVSRIRFKIVIEEIDVAVESCFNLVAVWGKILNMVLNFQLT